MFSQLVVLLRIGDLVQKEELLHLHMLFVHVKKYYESTHGDEVCTTGYDGFCISPVHIHKNKSCHKEAILMLGDELVGYLKSKGLSSLDYQEFAVPDEIVAGH